MAACATRYQVTPWLSFWMLHLDLFLTNLVWWGEDTSRAGLLTPSPLLFSDHDVALGTSIGGLLHKPANARVRSLISDKFVCRLQGQAASCSEPSQRGRCAAVCVCVSARAHLPSLCLDLRIAPGITPVYLCSDDEPFCSCFGNTHKYLLMFINNHQFYRFR